MNNDIRAARVLEFWFEELQPRQWWQKDSELDAFIRKRFSELHHQAAESELADWRKTTDGRLAEIIVLDQFSRNIYRGKPRAFAQDGMALALSQEAISAGIDTELPVEQRPFLYMPFMHSESAVIHQHAASLFNQPGLEKSLEFELKHKAIIDRFGRYPHRNEVLGRQSTPEEREFLQHPGSSF